MIICCTLFGVRSFAFEVRSWAGNSVPVNLYQVNAILCCDKKGWGHQAQLSLSEVQILAKRRQISADGSLRARSPDCPAAMAEEARHPGPSWSSSSSGYLDSRGQVLQTVTQADSNCQHVAEAGVGEKVHRCFKVWTGSVHNLVKGSGRTELPACFLDPLTHPLAEAG